MTVWLGYPLTPPVAWLPWLLTVVHATVRHPRGWGTVGVASVTAVLLLSGALDIGGQVLLTSGIYAVYLLCLSWVAGGQRQPVVLAASGLAVAWGLGFVIAAPYWLPLVDYMRTGARMQARAAGSEERPPGGLAELPRVIVPEAYGNSRPGSVLIREGNLLESSAGAYAGLLAAMFFAPLAFDDRRRRSQVVFWSGLAIVSLGWQLNLPILVQFLRLPGLNMLSFNRWVFATSFSLLVLAAVGLERLLSGPIPFQRWFVWPASLSFVIGLWCLALSLAVPSQIGTALRDAVPVGQQPPFDGMQGEAIQTSFRMCFQVAAFLSFAAGCGWLCILRGGTSSGWAALPLGGLLLGELMWFAHLESRSRLADGALYYPRLAVLEKLSQLPAGRILGLQCLYPNLNQTHGLRDIRGYDAVDPYLLMKLFDAVRDPNVVSPRYARTFQLVPKFEQAANGEVMPPILNMLNVRYLISREEMSGSFPLVVQQDDYWIYENPAALPRAFVPRTVRAVPDDDHALQRMAQSDFDPREVGFLHTPNPPPFPESCEGEVRLLRETPLELEFDVEMQTDGLVVVSDLWDASWRATLDGQPVDVHRANITLRGIPVGQGSHILKMTYAPKSVRRAFQASFAATGLLLLWATIIWRSRRSHGLTASEPIAGCAGCLATPIGDRLSSEVPANPVVITNRAER